MPAIHLFNRKSLSGGDDLHLPCLLASGLRLIQLFLLIPIWWHLTDEANAMGGWYKYLLYDPSNDPSCRHSHFFPIMLVTYAAASTLCALVGLGLELRTFQVSSWGTPTEPGDRTQRVQGLLEFKLVPFTIAQALIFLTGVCAVCGFAAHYHHCVKDNTNDDLWQDMNAWLDGDTDDSQQSVVRSRSWWWAAYVFLLLLQLTEVQVAIFFLRGLLSQPASSSTAALAYHPHHHELAEEMWVERCTNFCQCIGMGTCFLFGGREVALGEYGDIARALADYFETGGVLDLVPSDIAAGVLVLQRIQRQRMLQARHLVVSDRRLIDHRSESPLLPMGSAEQSSQRSSDTENSGTRQTTYLMHQEGSQTFYEEQTRNVLSRHNPYDLYTLHEGARFGRYALAIYTWVLYVYSYPISGIPRLLCNKRGCCCSGNGRREQDLALQEDDGVLVGDNCCQMHKSALLLHAGLEHETDLVYAQLNSSFSETPYCVLLDHKWKAVVVAIRGTFSLEDCVTDVLIDPEPLDALGEEFGFDGAGQHCHGGVLSCARIVYRDLQRHGILDRLLTGPNAEYPDYHLRLVGHSLGAATSTLLSFMMRQRFPTLRCINFSPPGCALSWKLAIESQEFCTSFILDCELVPRLSLDSMEHLRDEILGIIGRIQVPKVSVVNQVVRGTGFFSGKLCLDGDLEDEGETLEASLNCMLCPPDQVPQDSDYQHQLNQFRRIQSDRKLRRGDARAIKMFPPGKLVHLIKTAEKPSCMHAVANCMTCCTTNFGSEYTPVWVKNDDFNEIVVSPTMATDHFPNRMKTEMEGVARDYGIDISQAGSYPIESEQFLERA